MGDSLLVRGNFGENRGTHEDGIQQPDELWIFATTSVTRRVFEGDPSGSANQGRDMRNMPLMSGSKALLAASRHTALSLFSRFSTIDADTQLPKDRESVITT